MLPSPSLSKSAKAWEDVHRFHDPRVKVQNKRSVGPHIGTGRIPATSSTRPEPAMTYFLELLDRLFGQALGGGTHDKKLAMK
jgi:hypothetical protein